MKNTGARKHNSSGFTLMEVLIGILIFALGMMALAKLQGNLARNSGDSNARTVATNIAEEAIEAARQFSQITSDGTNSAYNDIVDGSATINRGGNVYTVDTDVTDYYINPNGSASTSAPTGVLRSDMKLVELTVTWNTNREFQIDENTTTSGQMGTGSIAISDMISSITSPASGKVVLGTDGTTMHAPPVQYNPGANPDIVSIQLGANKFKESTTPLPDVTRTEELVETTFDVVTYSQDNSGATFLRREEFKSVSCECILRAPDNDDQGGLRPTIWEGYEYTEAEFVSKAYGESANPQQSQFCDLCCRDHHDGGTGTADSGADPGRSLYNPFRSSGDYLASGSMAGDHKHYDRNRDGDLVLAENEGDTYVEACRMIRKDGFWRIAQNLRQEGLNSFPGDYLDEEGEVDTYSDYVTDAVTAYEAATGNGYESNPPALTPPAGMTPAVNFPASTPENPTEFNVSGVTEQQLRARGIYIDYLTDVLRARITCLEGGAPGADCDVPDVTSPLEIIPFYDVQLTWLARWTETEHNNPVDVTNEAIADDNSHTRGLARLTSGFGTSTIHSAIHTGNLGLTGTDPIDPWYSYDEKNYNMYALAIDFSSPPPLSGETVSGTITASVGGVKATDIEIEATDAQCDRTNTGFECVIEATANNPRLEVSNYFKRNKILVACSDVLTTHGNGHSGTNPSGNWTRFDLPVSSVTNANIVIRENSCN